jgi:hypothetical protein
MIQVPSESAIAKRSMFCMMITSAFEEDRLLVTKLAQHEDAKFGQCVKADCGRMRSKRNSRTSLQSEDFDSGDLKN